MFGRSVRTRLTTAIYAEAGPLAQLQLRKRSAFTRDQNTIQVRSQVFKQLPPDQGVQRPASLIS